jgi:S1-C subfamily serine protease
MNNGSEKEQAHSKSWTEFASDAIQNHKLELGLSAFAVVALVASRGKLSGVAEKFLPKLGMLTEEGSAKELSSVPSLTGSVRASLPEVEVGSAISIPPHENLAGEQLVADTATVKKLEYDFDPTKVQTAFGSNVRALPSMSVIGDSLEQRVSVVSADSAIAKLYDQVNPAVFHLYELWNDKEFSVGTTFLTEENFLVTARHCLTNPTKPKDLFIRLTEGGERVPLSIVARDYSADVGLLKFTKPIEGLPEPIKLGWASAVRKDQNVTGFGFPAQANRMVVTEGLVTDVESMRMYPGEDKTILHPLASNSARLTSRVSVWGGNSGGPLMAGENAVGVVTNSITDAGGSRATAIEHVRLLIDQAKKHPDLTEPLEIHSFARVLGKGKEFTVKIERLDLSVADTIEKPGS